MTTTPGNASAPAPDGDSSLTESHAGPVHAGPIHARPAHARPAHASPSDAGSSTAIDVGTSTALRVGIDLGSRRTVFVASDGGERLEFDADTTCTVVGFPKRGVIPGVLPSDSDALVGDEASEMQIHLDVTWPVKDGLVEDVGACRLVTRHVRELIDPDGMRPMWGVVGAPVGASGDHLDALRATMVGVLDRLVVVPEPCLAAAGMPEDADVRSAAETDPGGSRLIVDIGLARTDLCLVRGADSTVEHHLRIPHAGEAVDDDLVRLIRKQHPGLDLGRRTLQEIKERHAFVGGGEREARVPIYADGRPQTLDLAVPIREACERLLAQVVGGIEDLLARHRDGSGASGARDPVRTVVLTGGGSRIGGLCERVEETLRSSGWQEASVLRPADPVRLVARGALRMAETMPEASWVEPA